MVPIRKTSQHNRPKYSLWCRLLLLCISFAIVKPLIGQSKDGLLFKSYETPIADRSLLHLSPDKALAFDQQLEISFEATMWRMLELGYLLRLTSEDISSRIDLLYRPGEEGTGVFKLNMNGNDDGPEIALPNDVLLRNNWLNIAIRLDKASGQLSLEIDGKRAESETQEIKDIGPLNAVFGMSPYGLPSAVAIPRFGLRNLSLTWDSETHFWPLSKSADSKLTSEDRRYSIQVTNPEWITDTHSQWQFQYSREVEKTVALAFDQTKSEVYILEESQLNVFNLGNKSIREYSIGNSFPKDEGTQYAQYSEGQSVLYAYDLQPKNAFTFNTQNALWENTPNTDSVRVHRWHPATFENKLNGNPMMFGGYGFFQARNTLLEFDSEAKEWKEIPLKGDIPEPRSMVGIAEGYQRGQYYIYGGYGNETGEQDRGYQNLSDLYSLDLNDSTVTQLWARQPGTTWLLPSATMVLNQEDSSIYAMGYSYLGGNNEIELIKISINRSAVEKVELEENLPFEIRGIGDFNLYLHYVPQTKELVSIQRITDSEEQSKLQIHSISFPPQAVNRLETVESAGTGQWILIVLGALVLGGLILIYIRRKPGEIPTTVEASVTIPKKEFPITLFGEFKITDPEGAELTQKLSPKLKELFLLILIYGLSEKGGIATSKLTELLWPDASPASAKNNRGVNLQKLRQALSPLKELEVVFAENKWAVTLSSGGICDLCELLQAMRRNDLTSVMGIAARGPLLPNTHYEWLDNFKIDFHFKINQYLLTKAQEHKAQSKWSMMEQIARAILSIDPVNDEALLLLVGALVASKKAGIAQRIYIQFCDRYQSMYEEPYPHSFNDLLSPS